MLSIELSDAGVHKVSFLLPFTQLVLVSKNALSLQKQFKECSTTPETPSPGEQALWLFAFVSW